MRMLIKLAWRNIWRNSRRSLLTILAVLFATMLSVVLRGLMIGVVESNIITICRTFSGYLQIQRAGYKKNPSVQLSFTYTDSLRSVLANTPGITGFTPRIESEGLVSSGTQSLGALLVGIVPETERSVSDLPTRVHEGAFLGSDSTNEVVVGYKLLQNLNATIGESIVVLAQGYDGSLGNMKFRIVGTVKTGWPDLDGMTIFLGFSSMRDLLGMGDRVHTVAISLDDLRSSGQTKEAIERQIADPKITVLTWEGIMPDFKKHIEMDQARSVLFLWILVLIVAFGLLNTLLMSVTERFREFGVVLSMGMPHNKLVVVVLLETLFITGVGVLAGNLAGAAINYYLIVHPILLQGFERFQEEFGFVYEIQSSLRSSVFFDSSWVVLLLSLLASVYPLHRVRQLEPLKGLRFT